MGRTPNSDLPSRELVLRNSSVDGLPDISDERLSTPGTYVPPRKTLPWERQPGEPAHAYRGFVAYRDLSERTIRKAAQSLHSTSATLSRWAYAWRWDERVNAWDQEVDRRKTQAALKAVERMGERHVSLALKVQQLVAGRLNDMPDDGSTLSNKDVIAWLKEAVRIERRARGLSDTPMVSLNVTQQTAVQNQQANVPGAQAESYVAQRTISELIAGNPSLLGEVNAAVSGLLEAADRADDVVDGEYSSRNEQPEPEVPGE